MRRFPPPWTVEKIAGGFKVLDANGQSLTYVYSRETKDAANIAGVLTEDEVARSKEGRTYLGCWTPAFTILSDWCHIPRPR